MAITLNGTTGITSPGGDSSAVDVTTPKVKNAGTLALEATGANVVTFSTNGSERGRFDGIGNLLVGSTSAAGGAFGNAPGVTIGNGRALQFQSTGFATYGLLNFQNNLVFANGADRFVLDPAGNMTLTTGNLFIPSDKDIHSGGLVINPNLRTTGAGATCHWEPTGGGFFRSVSSIRYKRNVQNLSRGLEDVMNLRPVSYQSNSDIDGEKVFGGLIAEEVHETGMTEFVQYDGEGKPESLHYSNMVSLAFKAIQEQQTLIQALTARIEALEVA